MYYSSRVCMCGIGFQSRYWVWLTVTSALRVYDQKAVQTREESDVVTHVQQPQSSVFVCCSSSGSRTRGLVFAEREIHLSVQTLFIPFSTLYCVRYHVVNWICSFMEGYAFIYSSSYPLFFCSRMCWLPSIEFLLIKYIYIFLPCSSEYCCLVLDRIPSAINNDSYL